MSKGPRSLWLAPPESLAAPATPVAWPGHHEATPSVRSLFDRSPLNLAGRLFGERGDAFLANPPPRPAIRCDSNSKVELLLVTNCRAFPIQFSDQR